MSLPGTVTSSHRWPDFKNTPTGPFRGADTTSNLGASPTAQSEFGGLTSAEKRGQVYQAVSNKPLVRATFRLSKVGSPTDNVSAEFYATTGDPAVPTGSPIASLPISGLSIPVSPDWVDVTFVFPNPPAQVSGTKYAIGLKRSGALDNTNKYRVYYTTGDNYANGHRVTFQSGGWVINTGSDLDFVIEQQADNLYQFVLDASANKVRAFKSTDFGQSWGEVDPANAPSVSSTANFKSFSAQREFDKIYIATTSGSTTGNVVPFAMGSDSWQTALTGPAKTVNTSIAGTVPIFAFRRPNGSTVMIYQGATETVMGAAKARIKLCQHNGTSWGSEYDVVGSAGGGTPPGALTAPTTALPGNAVNYHLRAAVITERYHVCIFYTRDDDNLLRCRIWRYYSLDPLSENFSNNLNPATADTSNSAKYSVGQPVAFAEAGEPWVALPYKDASDTFLKLVKCKADETMFTAGNWTSEQIQAIAPETELSNPAALAADNSQGRRIYAFYTKSNRLIYQTQDQGSGNWQTEAQWGAGQTCGALGLNIADDRIGIVYLDEAPTPDEVRFDAITVFF